MPNPNNIPPKSNNPWQGQNSYQNPYQNPQNGGYNTNYGYPQNQDFQQNPYQNNQFSQNPVGQNFDTAKGGKGGKIGQIFSEMDTKKKVAIFSVGGIFSTILIVFLIILLAPKGNQNLLDNVSKSSCSKEVELTWLKPILANQDEKIFEKFTDDFERSYKNVKINIDFVDYDDDYYNNLVKSLAKRNGPDIFSIRNDDLPAYQELMTPITYFSGERLADYRQNFVSLVVKDTMVKDAVYGVSLYVDNLQLYYNNTILQQNSIAIPAQNWGDLNNHIKAITKVSSDGSTINQYGFSFGTGGISNSNTNIAHFVDIFPLMMSQSGQTIYDYKNETVSLTKASEANLGLKTLAEYTSYADRFNNSYTWNVGAENNIDAFVNGKLGYFLGYKTDWNVIKDRNPRLDFGVTSLPQKNENNKKTFGNFFMDGLSLALDYDEDGKAKKDCAEEFLAYLTTKQKDEKLDAGVHFASQTNLPSSRKDIIQNQLTDSEKSTQIFAQGALYAENYYKPNVLEVEKIWIDLLEDVQVRRIDANTAWNNAVERYSRLVKQGPQIR